MASAHPDTLKRVLLVDDEVALLRVTARVLARDGYHITCARSGQEAAQELAEHVFDAVVSDVHMPGMNGLQLMRLLRQYDPDVQILLITGSPDLSSATTAIEFGAFQFLTKPVSGTYLCHMVDLAIAATRAARLKREFIQTCGSGTFKVGDRAGVEAVLDSALQSLSMSYQPIVTAGEHALFGVEAFVRCEEPSLPDPEAMLDAAERTNRMIELGRIARGRVAADLLQTNPGDTLCFVNLHSSELADPQLLSRQSALSWLASHVVLEISERERLAQLPELSQHVADLRAPGFKIALDDLGAGYAGLSCFTQLDPDFVKLDIMLVRDVNDNPIKRQLVRAMIELSHEMGKQVIAEGVETVAEQTTLEALGCDLLQGYLFGRPQKGLTPALGAGSTRPRLKLA